jgi:integrase/recombinase XerD
MEVLQHIPLSIKLVAEESKQKKGTHYLFARIIYERKKALISLKMGVNIDEWNAEKEEFKPVNHVNILRNNRIREIKHQLVEIYFTLRKAKLPISSAAIKSTFLGECSSDSTTPFLEYFKGYIEELKRRPNEFGEGVIGHYMKTLTHLSRFLKLKGWEGLRIGELNASFLERFENYLLTTPNFQTGRPMNGNTATTYIRKIKAAVHAAIRKQLINHNPFVAFKVKPFKNANKIVLSDEELMLLKQNDFGGNLSLQRLRDVFLFCCYTGLRHSDVFQLTPDMVRKEKGISWITIKQQKTQETIEIPMQREAELIYNKYKHQYPVLGKALPVLSNQKTNTGLKVIATLTGLNKRLTFHCARHTFAVRTLEISGDIKAVSVLMGHSKVSTTEVYAKLTRNRKEEVIKLLNEKRLKK